MRYKSIVLSVLALLSVLISSPVFASQGFLIKGIEIRGLNRLPQATARAYVPLHVGTHYDSGDSSRIIRAFYKTGYFKDVRVGRQGSTLVISVTERPTIGKILIDGNKVIKSKALGPILKGMGIEVGETYSPHKLNEIVQGLVQQYDNMGYPHVTVTPTEQTLSNNRVAIHIHVKEGGVLKVRSIDFDGNRHFSSRELRNQMSLSTPGILSWFSKKDHYSSFLLDADIQRLQTFYLNNGYLKAVVSIKKVDKRVKGAYITITVREGTRYRVSGFKVSGKTQGEDAALLKEVTLKAGGYFSQRHLLVSQSRISDYFGNEGYAFPHVTPMPVLNTINHTVFFDFRIVPGARMYVHHISVLGNDRTRDIVIRRQLRELEGSLYSATEIARSKQRLMLMGFFQTVAIENKPVAGQPDFVDLTVRVKEMRTGTARVQAGYDTAYGITYGASITEKNFLGSGDGVSIGFQNNAIVQNYNIGFSEPYYRPNGLSRSFQGYYTRISNDPKYNLDSSFRQDGYGLSVNYGMPVSEHSSFSFGYGYENIDINHVNQDAGSARRAVPSVLDYLDLAPGKSARTYHDFTLTLGWGYTDLDRALFPTMGFSNGISGVVGVPVLKSSAPYYIASYSARWYQPLFAGFIVNAHTGLQYGSGFGRKTAFPFFKNFYMGGIGSLPGFEPNSLGPWNNLAQTALGGNVSILGGVNLILPEFISPKVRTMLTLTTGNVFDSPFDKADQADSSIVNLEKISFKNLRTSAGVRIEWYSPMGMIAVSIAKPLSKRANDQEKLFDFSFGTSF